MSYFKKLRSSFIKKVIAKHALKLQITKGSRQNINLELSKFSKKVFKTIFYKKSFSYLFYYTKIKHNKLLFLPRIASVVCRFNAIKISKLSKNLDSIKSIKIHKNLKFLNLYKNFINFIFRSGKKYIWDKTIAYIFLLLKKTIAFSQNIILLKIFLRLHTKVEVKKVKSRKKVLFVPVFISVRRRFFLALKWLLIAVKKNKLQISLKDKLFFEILKLVTDKSCTALKQLELNNNNVYLFRANFHYRW